MVAIVEIHGYDEFVKYAEAIDPKGPPVLFYFSGEKLPSGESWCTDCVEGKYSLCFQKLFHKLDYPFIFLINRPKM